MFTRSSDQSAHRVRASFVMAFSIVVAIIGASCGSTSNNGGSPTTTAADSGNAYAVRVLVNEGIAQTKAHMLDQAETTFRDVLLLSPKNVYALFDLGVIDQTQGNTAGALSYYSQALSADGSYVPALYNEAIILQTTNPNAALVLYQQIVSLEPKAATAYLQMAFLYAKKGQHLKADEARIKAISLDAGLAKYPLPAKCARPNC
jgi:Tfp pilus assembly protein PilF